MNLKEYVKKSMEHPFETIVDVVDNNDETITITSVLNLKHPDCPVVMLNFPRYSEAD